MYIGAATYELKALMVRLLSRHVRIHPGISLSFFVDDGVENITGVDDIVAGILASHEDLVNALQNELGLPISEEKLAIVGTNVQQVSKISRAFSLPNVCCASTRDLGVDYTAARRGSRGKLSVRKGRLKKFCSVVSKISSICKSNRAASKLFYSGALPQGMFGSEVWGVDDTDIYLLRKSAAKCLGFPRRCSLDLAFSIAPHLDPARAHAVAPLVHDAKAGWKQSSRVATCKGGIALKDICQGFCNVSSKVDPASSWARGIRGPVSAAILCASRLGWSFLGPTKVQKRCGAIRDLTLFPPSVIKKEALEAFSASSAVKAVPRALDPCTPTGNRIDGLMILPLSRVFKSKGLSNLQRQDAFYYLRCCLDGTVGGNNRAPNAQQLPLVRHARALPHPLLVPMRGHARALVQVAPPLARGSRVPTLTVQPGPLPQHSSKRES